MSERPAKGRPRRFSARRTRSRWGRFGFRFGGRERQERVDAQGRDQSHCRNHFAAVCAGHLARGPLPASFFGGELPTHTGSRSRDIDDKNERKLTRLGPARAPSTPLELAGERFLVTAGERTAHDNAYRLRLRVRGIGGERRLRAGVGGRKRQDQPTD
jgi:hypothetical protein